MPDRRGPMPRGEPLTRSVPLNGGEPLRRTRIVARVPAKARQQRRTGPTETVRLSVVIRAGGSASPGAGEKGHPGWCEWIDCRQLAALTHHRLNRKMGGRHGDAHERLNQSAWLVRLCRDHDELVTRPKSALDRAIVEALGYVLTEQQDAREVPILTRHSRALVLLDNAGGWTAAA